MCVEGKRRWMDRIGFLYKLFVYFVIKYYFPKIIPV